MGFNSGFKGLNVLGITRWNSYGTQRS